MENETPGNSLRGFSDVLTCVVLGGMVQILLHGRLRANVISSYNFFSYQEKLLLSVVIGARSSANEAAAISTSSKHGPVATA